jgi:hypothetical protein
VYFQYLKDNDCWELREKQRVEKEKFRQVGELRNRILNGTFSEELKEGFRKVLAYYGNTPIIVRSSSFLEDGYGNAFSGKYASIFCMNQGDMEERLADMEDAIRQIYASTLNPSALEYRRRRKLLGADEQMALLVQRVEGEKHGNYYFPVAAGMGCSYNPYKWMEHMNPDAGMLRLVVGLGTRAVERTPGDYPRLIGLDRAQASLYTSIAQRHKYSQRRVDVLDLEEKELVTKPLLQLVRELSEPERHLVLSRDTEAEERLSQRRQYREIYFADCQGLVEHPQFARVMRKILHLLETEYERPVDVEFAVRATPEQGFMINLFQCRPLQVTPSEEVEMPEDRAENLLFDVHRTSMRRSKKEKIDVIVHVDPRGYYEYPHVKKPDVGRMIRLVNQYYRESEKNLMLLVPGRIGTSSPELGVPVVYADISEFGAICEVAYSEAGYRPELSYGSHMFQDLVEADVYYGAINENRHTRCYRPQMLRSCPNIFEQICPNETELGEIVRVYDVSEKEVYLLLDAKEGRAVCEFVDTVYAQN